MIIICHGSTGINKITKTYISVLKQYDDVYFELFENNEKHNCKGSLKYISNPRNILNNEKRYQCLYKTIVFRRLNHIYQMINKLNQPVTLLGISEGGAAVCLANHPLIQKKIIVGFSCEYNYFLPIKNPLVSNCPSLVMLGERDPFFSKHSNSVASIISRKSLYYKNHIIKGKPKYNKNIHFVSIEDKAHNILPNSIFHIILFLNSKTMNLMKMMNGNVSKGDNLIKKLIANGFSTKGAKKAAKSMETTGRPMSAYVKTGERAGLLKKSVTGKPKATGGKAKRSNMKRAPGGFGLYM